LHRPMDMIRYGWSTRRFQAKLAFDAMTAKAWGAEVDEPKSRASGTAS
jgi:hypothetical protein